MRIEPNGENSAGHFSFPGNFKLFVNGALWTAWSENPSVIPSYILDALDVHDIQLVLNLKDGLLIMK